MRYVEIDGNVYEERDNVTVLVGSVSYIATDRVNESTIVDVTYTFDFEVGEYVEQSRTERPAPPPEKTQEQQEIETLKAENLELKLAMAELAETQEADKLTTQLALAELAELIAGGA